MKGIVSIAKNIIKPTISKDKTYEVDELCTYIRHNKNYIWLVYIKIGIEYSGNIYIDPEKLKNPPNNKFKR